MSKSKGGGSSAPAPAAQDPMQQINALQQLGGMGSGGGMNAGEDYTRPTQQQEFARLFPALAQMQDFRNTFKDDMRQQAMAGILKMFGGGG